MQQRLMPSTNPRVRGLVTNLVSVRYKMAHTDTRTQMQAREAEVVVKKNFNTKKGNQKKKGTPEFTLMGERTKRTMKNQTEI